jgi:hypothetical protein
VRGLLPARRRDATISSVPLIRRTCFDSDTDAKRKTCRTGTLVSLGTRRGVAACLRGVIANVTPFAATCAYSADHSPVTLASACGARMARVARRIPRDGTGTGRFLPGSSASRRSRRLAPSTTQKSRAGEAAGCRNAKKNQPITMKYWSSSRVGAVPQASESQNASRKKESGGGSRFQRKQGITMEVSLDRREEGVFPVCFRVLGSCW